MDSSVATISAVVAAVLNGPMRSNSQAPVPTEVVAQVAEIVARVLNAQPARSVARFDHLPDSAQVSVADLAQLYRVSRATIWRRVASGVLPAPLLKPPGSTATRWRVGDVRAALAKQGEAA